MTRLAIVYAAVVLLAGCSGLPDAGRVCEGVEPFRPLIRGAVTAIAPPAALPFAVTRNVSCADLKGAAENLRDQAGR